MTISQCGNSSAATDATVYNCCVMSGKNGNERQNTSRIDLRRGSLLLAAIVVTFIAGPVTAQQDEVEELTQRATESEAIDEITVYGERSMSSLRVEVYRAEENFFDLFSELNDDDEFDVRCFYETPTGTRIRQHVCRAQFVTEAYSAEFSRYRVNLNYPVQDPEVVVMRKSRELEEKMHALIIANPNLKQALNRYTNARTNYISERARRYPGMRDDEIPEEQ